MKATFQLQILGVKKNPQSPMYTQLGVMTKGTVIEVNVSELGMVTAGGKVVFGKYAQVTNNPENDGCINAVLCESSSLILVGLNSSPLSGLKRGAPFTLHLSFMSLYDYSHAPMSIYSLDNNDSNTKHGNMMKCKMQDSSCPSCLF